MVEPVGVVCPACRYKISIPADHEPGCPNSDWDTSDIIDRIKYESAKAGNRDREP